MGTLFWIGIFVASLAILVKASDYFTDAAEKIGVFFRMPAFIIGVTIVAIGTSLPELTSSIIAVLQGTSEIVVGNVVGSNITNIFLVLGLAAFVAIRIKLGYEIINVDLPILMGSAFLLAMMIIDGKFTLFEAFLCLAGLGVYFMRAIQMQKKMSPKEKRREQKLEKDLRREFKFFGLKLTDFPVGSLVVLLISGFFIFIGAKFTIDSTIAIAEIFNIAPAVIAATMIALGTSLPELVVSLSAAKKGKAEIAVGTILGSNIFNALGVMGIAGLFGTLVIPSSIILFGLPIMLIATIMYLFITQDKEITRWEGAFLIIFYLFYIGAILGWA